MERSAEGSIPSTFVFVVKKEGLGLSIQPSVMMDSLEPVFPNQLMVAASSL